MPMPMPIAALLTAVALAASAVSTTPDLFAERRATMVASIEHDIRAAASTANIPSLDRVLAIVGRLPREQFVLPAGRDLAYVDIPQSIGHDQTISDPHIVTVMTAALDLPPNANVLDIGTGSGYQAAVLSPLAAHVSSIEIVAPLARSAMRRLRKMGYRNIDVRHGDGFAGWPDHAPFDGIVVAAGAGEIPRPLLNQLKIGGRLVMPIGPSLPQEQLLLVTRLANGGFDRCSLGLAMFVALTGRGQRPADERGLIDKSIPYCFGHAIT